MRVGIWDLGSSSRLGWMEGPFCLGTGDLVWCEVPRDSSSRALCCSQKWCDILFANWIPWRLSEGPLWCLNCIFAASTGQPKRVCWAQPCLLWAGCQGWAVAEQERAPWPILRDLTIPTHRRAPTVSVASSEWLGFFLPPASLSSAPNLARSSFVLLNQYFSLTFVLFFF